MEKAQMEKHNNELIYENRVKAGKRTYFFDVKKTNKGFPYLEITESRKRDENNFLRTNIMLFHEDMENFKNELNDVFEKFFKDLPVQRDDVNEK
jgi:hypothetical protein